MSVEVMTKAQEGKLVDSVMEAITLANEGLHPNDAVIKIASAVGYNQDYVRRMVEAFNVSKSLKHQKSASGDAKADAFDIADPEVILGKMYPDGEDTPDVAKAAEWEPSGTNMEETRFFDLEHAPVKNAAVKKEVHTYDGQSIDILLKRACNELYRKERSLEDVRHKMASDRMSLLGSIDKFASYFKSLDHEPFARVEGAAIAHYGKSIAPLMDNAYTLCKGAAFGEARAEGAWKPIAIKDRAPYAMLSDIMTCRDQYAHSVKQCSTALIDMNDYKDKLNRRMRIFSKIAGAGGAAAMGGAVASAVSNLLSKLPTSTPADEAPGLAQDVLPPAYEAERKSIQTNMMLNDFLKSDPVISKADPQRVLSAYNDISSIAPRSTGSSAIMRSLLRKAVESESFDPFELSNITKLETEMGKQDSSDIKVK